MSRFRVVVLIPLFALLGGCKATVLAPSGDVALQQRNLLIEATGLMLLVIIPVIALTILFAWRYRASNETAPYEPDWSHSTGLELIIWGAPLLIVICLGALTWVGTHLLDPYRGIGRIAAGVPVAPGTKPLQVDVVSLDWKWLFIYPEYGIATVNELAAPVDRPVDFRITSSTVMNSFYIPAMAGQIYAMPGMETKLHAVINKAGDYEGFSANYSGAGFSGMHFVFHGLDAPGFEAWIAAAKAAGGMLDRAAYIELERPSENDPVRRFAGADPKLFERIVNMCVEPGKMCAREMMAIDAKGGLGLAGLETVLPLEYDKTRRRGAVFGPPPSYAASLCRPGDELAATGRSSTEAAPVLPFDPVLGAGLPRPSATPDPAFTHVRTAPTTPPSDLHRPSNS